MRARMVLAALVVLVGGTAPAVLGPGTVPAAGAAARASVSGEDDLPTVPKVRQLRPTRGPVAGGTRVTITGTGLAGATRVTFGDTDGTNLVVVSDKTLRVTSPARPRGVTTVRVYTDEKQSYPNWGAFFVHDDDRRTVVAMPPSRSDPDDPTMQLNDLACAAPGVCVGVGTYRRGDQRRAAFAEVLRAGTWTTQALPDPSGPSIGRDTVFDVNEVECPAAATCIAVGSWSERSSIRPLAFRWDGTTWSTQPLDGTAAPIGSLQHLACPSATSCVALGLTCLTTICEPIAYTLSGTTWSRTPILRPPDVDGVTIQDLSCSSPTSCLAVGSSFLTETDTEPSAPLTLRYDGAAWTVARATVPADALPSDPTAGLAAVSCAPEGCRALGYYRATGGGDRVYLSTLTSAGETQVPLGYPAGTDGTFRYRGVSLSCIGFDFCRANVGFYRSYGQYRGMFVGVDGGVPTATPVPPNVGTTYAIMAQLTCPSTTVCLTFGGTGIRRLADRSTYVPLPDPLAPGGTIQVESDQTRACPRFFEYLVADSPTTAVAAGGCFAGPAQHAVLTSRIRVPRT